MKHQTVVLTAVIVLALNSTLLAAPPDWTKGRSARYPEGLYLVGVGSGASRERAEELALASLAKIFQAEVSQKTTEWEKYLQTESRGKSHVEQKKAIEQITKVSTDKVLEGAEIVERGEEEGIFYALAVIDRLQSTASLTGRIKELDEKIRQALDRARFSGNKLERIKHYRRALEAYPLRDAYQSDLRIVNIKGEGIAPPISADAVLSEYKTWLAKHFLVNVQITGPQGDQVEKGIIDSLAREGFVVVAGEGGNMEALSVDLLIQGDVRLSQMELPGQPFQYVRWCFDLELLEKESNRIVGIVVRSGREGHLSLEEAEARALRLLVPEASSDISGKLAEYLGGEFQPQEKRASSCKKTAPAPKAPKAPASPASPPTPP